MKTTALLIAIIFPLSLNAHAEETSSLSGRSSMIVAKNGPEAKDPYQADVIPATKKSNAVESSPITSLGYLPKPGEFEIAAALTSSYSQFEYTNSGTKVGDYTTTAGGVGLGIGAGLFGNLAASVSLTSVNTKTKSEPVGSSSTEATSKGAGAPVIGLSYKILERNSAQKFDLIVGARYNLKTSTQKIGTTIDDGNSQPSNSYFDIHAGLYRQVGIWEFGIELSVTPGYSGEAENATTGAKTKYDEPGETDIQFLSQWYFGDSFILTARGGIAAYGESKSTDSTNDVTTKESGSAVTGAVGLKYVILPNLYVQGELGVIGYSNVDVKDSTTTYKSENHASSTLATGIVYAF